MVGHNYNLKHRVSIHCIAKVIAFVLVILPNVQCLKADNEQKNLLVINSYSVSAPWGQSFSQPVNQLLSEVDDVHLELVTLNSAEITDSATYYSIEDKIFESFKDKHPSYVIMVGNFAFFMRDRIKAEWGDIPMLLVTRIDRYAPLNYYLAGYEGEWDWESMPKISDIRDNYNMTLIETPDFADETVDLMMQVIPDMKKLVFIGDRVFTNRALDRRIHNYLHENYPEVGYEWLQQTDSTISQFQEYMLNRYPHTGLLLSTWNDIPPTNDLLLSVTGSNLHMLSSSLNPVFTLRTSCLSLGSLGGVYSDDTESSKKLIHVVKRMLAGDDMRTLPMYFCDKPVPIINQQRMHALGYAKDTFPEHTKYIFRSPTILEEYRTEIISSAVILALIVGGILIYMSIQRKRISILETHASFIKLMPWAYSKAHIIYEGDKVVDIEFDHKTMNAAFLNLLSANMIDDRDWKIFPFSFIADKTRQLLETGQPQSFVYHFDKTDSYYEFLLCRVNPRKLRVNDQAGDVDIFANNITQRVKAEHKMRIAMHALDVTLCVARILPWQWAIDEGKIYYDGFRTLHTLKTGHDYEPITRRYSTTEAECLSNIDPDDRDRVSTYIKDMREGKITHAHDEFKIDMNLAGRVSQEWVEVNALVTEYDKDNRPKMVLGSMMVITERKRQEKALIEAKEQASESDRMKSAFLANMSHEIRTPLNAIVGFSSLITQTDDREQKAKYSGIIAHNNDLLLHLINDVLDLAKIESNTLELHMIDTDINELMHQIYETVRLRIANGVIFNMVLGADKCTCRVDPNRVMQVLINLLTNAAKFTQKGSITYGYEINGDEIEFFVRDTGIGISKEDQEKLFKRFSKLNNFKQGTGLGLSICKSFVEKMGGQIWAKSRGEGKGSTFTFTLPFIKCEAAADIKITEETVIETPLKQGNDITILVAEDNDSNYVLFESILSKYYKLLHATNGLEAVQMYREYKPQLILMDISMPELDGYQATEQIRQISKTVPIIAVTAHAFVTDKDKIPKSGFNGYVPKPINPSELLKCVKTQLSKRFFVF